MNRAKELSAKEVQNLKGGVTAVGKVSGLCIKKINGGKSGSWILKYTLNGKRRECGLGAYKATNSPGDGLTLSEAREKAAELRKQIEAGIDPIDAKRQAREQAAKEERRGLTFEQAARMWFDDVQEEREKSNRNWRRHEEPRLNKNVIPAIGSIPIAQLSEMDVLRCLEPVLRSGRKGTFDKLRPMIRQISAWASIKGFRENKLNPAGGALTDFLGTLNVPKAETTNHAACAVEEVPRLMRELLQTNNASARALAFCILTACRSEAARGAVPEDIDAEAGIYTVRPENDKIKDKNALRDIMLSSYALEFLKALPKIAGEKYLFTSAQGGMLTAEALNQCLRRLHAKRKRIDGVGWVDPVQTKREGKDRVITTHGMRAAFGTWVEDDVHGNNRRFDKTAVEKCLLHKTDTKFNGAYSRGEYAEERRRIMEAWGRYCMEGKWPDER